MAVSGCRMLLVIAAAFMSGDASDELLHDLQGTWRPESILIRGNELDSRMLPYSEKEYRIEKDKLTVVGKVFNREVKPEMRIKVDGSTTPKSMDLCFPDGTVFRGIYAVDGDVLLVCMPRDGTAKRPITFSSRLNDNPADRIGVYILRRQPK